jgi:hypothetical protein
MGKAGKIHYRINKDWVITACNVCANDPRWTFSFRYVTCYRCRGSYRRGNPKHYHRIHWVVNVLRLLGIKSTGGG